MRSSHDSQVYEAYFSVFIMARDDSRLDICDEPYVST